MALRDVNVPNLGEFKDVEIIEVHVQEGATVSAEDPLITLETDKASMDVPAPAATPRAGEGRRHQQTYHRRDRRDRRARRRRHRATSKGRRAGTPCTCLGARPHQHELGTLASPSTYMLLVQ